MNTNIILIGFMGSGKTTVGRELSKELDKPFIDMDEEIEKMENITISEIFKINGEKYFRDIETNFLKSFKDTDSIISTGGGVILKEENTKLLKQLGKIIFLHADINHILNNLKEDDSRPLLQTSNYK